MSPIRKTLMIACLGALSTAALANEPGSQTGQGAREKAMFQRADTNHDGVLSFEESSAFHRQMQAQRQAQGGPNGQAWEHANDNAMFKRADTNNDGVLSQEEKMAFQQHRQSERQQHQEMMARGIPVAMLDTNGDGYITKEEHEAAKMKRQEQQEEHKAMKEEWKKPHQK